MNIWTKIFIVLFPLIIYVVLNLLFKLLKLKKRKGIKVFDIFLIFLVFGLDGFVKNATSISIFPYYIMIASGIGLFLLLIDLLVHRTFQVNDFLKRFWRVLLIDSSVMYFCFIVATLFI
ncbi:DUF3397 family protein [Lactovum miscens]|uniref:Fatty-acid desaturase n=1 Tax=Lactovum miscens TaxID=190387 RepID=A0A841C6R5_9LACT|nr:fatty-acid desaturase [Lactovum miscens]